MNKIYYYLAMFDKNTKNENSGGLVNEIFTETTHIPTSVTICVYICTIIIVLKFFYTLYKIFARNLKKKYTNSSRSNTPPSPAIRAQNIV